MKFSCNVVIKAPRKTVISLFLEPNNLKEWQDNFKSYTVLTGKHTQEGTLSKILYDIPEKQKTMQLLETILHNKLPGEYTAIYEHTHMTNIMQNLFVEVDANTTQWVANLHYTKIKGFFPKTISVLFPGMFKMQTQKWLNQFRDFAEQSHQDK